MERAWYEQEELNKYLKQKWNENKSKEQKKCWFILIYFLTETMILSNL